LAMKEGVDGRDKPGHDMPLIHCNWKMHSSLIHLS
jgi:hypothetical protein